MNNRETWRAWKTPARGVLLAGLVCAGLIAACGSDSSSTSKSSAATADKLTAQAGKELAPYRGIPSFSAPGPKVNAASVKDKNILIVAASLIPDELVGIVDGAKAAGEALGQRIEIFDGKGNVSRISQGIMTGARDRVGAIVLDGVDPEQYPGPLTAAANAKVPVIAVASGLNVRGPGIFGTSSADYVLSGKLMAWAAIADAGGDDVEVVYLAFPNPSTPDVLGGIESVFEQCACGKVVAQKSVYTTEWSTKVAPTISSTLKANPNAKYVLARNDTQAVFALSGIKLSGLNDVKVLSIAGTPGALKFVQEGSQFFADLGQSAEWTGWGAIDQALRAMTGMQPAKDVTPTRYLDQAGLKGLDINDPTSLFGDAQVDGYKGVWGLEP